MQKSMSVSSDPSCVIVRMNHSKSNLIIHGIHVKHADWIDLWKAYLSLHVYADESAAQSL